MSSPTQPNFSELQLHAILTCHSQEQPLLRLPHELTRKNFKSIQRALEHAQTTTIKEINRLAARGLDVPTAENPVGNEHILATLDTLIKRLNKLKDQMVEVQKANDLLLEQSKARVQHLADLHKCKSLNDVAYENWSRVRLDRLLVDYLLRQGYGETAEMLAKDKGIEKLVDLGVFERCRAIERSIKEGRVQEALAWCAEHKGVAGGGSGVDKKRESVGGANVKTEKSMFSKLEFGLRLQQHIELVRDRKVKEAREHAAKYLVAYVQAGDKSKEEEVFKAAALLLYPPSTKVGPYKVRALPLRPYLVRCRKEVRKLTRKVQRMYSPERYVELAELFVKTHHELFSLPAQPLLHIALSAGLSALKTPACHSTHTPGPEPIGDAPRQSNILSALGEPSTSQPAVGSGTDSNTHTRLPSMNGINNVCPICSTELNELARPLPYAHHSVSWVENDPVVLPNGRVYGRERLMEYSRKVGVAEGKVKDLVDGRVYGVEDAKKVFIT
jgi:macrophage erythroblast attacher